MQTRSMKIQILDANETKKQKIHKNYDDLTKELDDLKDLKRNKLNYQRKYLEKIKTHIINIIANTFFNSLKQINE